MLGFTFAVAACGPEVSELGIEGDTDGVPTADTTPSPDETPDATPVPTSTGPYVGDYIGSSCATAVVRPLSVQLLAELNCIKPDAVDQIPPDNQIEPGTTFDFLQTPAGDSLPGVVDLRPGVDLRINSALRSLAQQYMLYQWYVAGRCGITLAATPGTSNHERGLALDIQDTAGWRNELESRNWDWIGASDPVHYDYRGAGTTNILGDSVLAFQRLWNRNNPGDTIAEDGDYGPATAQRLRRSPAGGFPQGSSCGAETSITNQMLLVADEEPEVCAL